MRSFLKIFSIILIIAMLGVGAYLGYRYLTAPQTQPASTAPSATAPTGTVAAALAVKAFSAVPAFDYWLNSKTGAVYYATSDGKVFRTFGDSRDQSVSEQTLPGLNAITASPDGTKAIAHFGYPNQDIFAVFDTELKTWERLPDGTRMAAFDPTSAKVAYISLLNNISRLFTLDVASKKATEVAKIVALDGTLLWPKANEVYIVSRPSEAVGVQVAGFDLVKKTLRFINKNDGEEIVWSPDGALGLKSQTFTRGGIQLTQINDAGAVLGGLPLTTTASKCSFAKDGIYCGVPTPPSTDISFFENSLKEKAYSTDSIVSYNLRTGDLKTILGSITTQVDATHFTVRNTQLLFLNRYDKKVYAVELPTEAKKQ